jgi:hypothetical protein
VQERASEVVWYGDIRQEERDGFNETEDKFRGSYRTTGF